MPHRCPCAQLPRRSPSFVCQSRERLGNSFRLRPVRNAARCSTRSAAGRSRDRSECGGSVAAAAFESCVRERSSAGPDARRRAALQRPRHLPYAHKRRSTAVWRLEAPPPAASRGSQQKRRLRADRPSAQPLFRILSPCPPGRAPLDRATRQGFTTSTPADLEPLDLGVATPDWSRHYCSLSTGHYACAGAANV